MDRVWQRLAGEEILDGGGMDRTLHPQNQRLKQTLDQGQIFFDCLVLLGGWSERMSNHLILPHSPTHTHRSRINLE